MWDAVRFAVDRDPAVGQFVLTGSAVPKDSEEVKHTGTGRFSRLRMRPMTLFESGESTGEVSLGALAEGSPVQGSAELGLEQVAHCIMRGGWPASVIRDDEYGPQRAIDYVESVAESDISRVDGVEKNPRRVRLLMRSLARNESTEAAMTTLQSDMAADEGRLSTNTIAVYLNALRRLYILDEQPPWARAVRSKVAMRSSPIRRYCDPSLPAALLRLSTGKLLTDFSTFGMLFESLAIRDLRVYAESQDATVSHYRDARGLECDAIVEWGDGRWGAIEVKLEDSRVEQAAATLSQIAAQVRSQHGGPPAFCAVVTATGLAYRRQDGIAVVPLPCLRP
jgi:predicted AAA+ superfamily ATPase